MMTEEEEFEFRLRFEQESQTEPVQEKPAEATTLEKVAGHPAYRAISAVGEPMMGIAELGARKLIDPITGVAGFGHPVGDYLSSAIDTRDQMIEKGRADRGSTGFDIPRAVGSVAAPVGIATKGAKVGKALTDKILAGGALGAGSAMSMPVGGPSEDYDKSKVQQGVAGAAFGGGMPVVGALLRKGGNFVDQVTKPLDFRNKPGAYRSVADALMTANEKIGGKVIPKEERTGIYQDVKEFAIDKAGDKNTKILRAMQGADKGQTANQAIAKANRLSDDEFGGQFVRLGRDLKKTPGAGDSLKQIEKNQIKAERATLDKLSGTDDALEAGQKYAKEQATTGYDAVKADNVNMDSFSDLLSRPSVAAGIKEARRSAAETGAYFPKEAGEDFSVGNLQRIKQAIGEKITTEKRAGSLGKSTEKEINDTMKAFVSELREKSPGFAKAEDEFIENMKPVNAMQIGRELRKNYSTPKGVTDSKFINAVDDPKKTIKKATGFRGAKQFPEGFGETNKITEALKNRITDKKMATETNSIMNELTGEIEISLPNMLSRPVLITNAALKMISKDKSPEYKKILIDAYRDPKKFEKLLTEPVKSKNRIMAEDILKNITTIGASQEAGRRTGEQ